MKSYLLSQRACGVSDNINGIDTIANRFNNNMQNIMKEEIYK